MKKYFMNFETEYVTQDFHEFHPTRTFMNFETE